MFANGARVDYDAIDPELRRLARVLPKGYGLERGLTLPRALMSLAGRLGRDRTVEVRRVNEHVTVRVHRPVRPAAEGPALLWIHGGGTLMGTAAQEDQFCRKLVNFTDVTVVAVEHRLAPEHPFPVPLEDCYAGLQWLARQPWVDPARLAIGGASAGGGFTAAVAQLARDRGEVALALQMMVYPMLDHRSGGESDTQKRVMWSPTDNHLAWKWYLDGADPMIASPARRGDLTGLAPAWIGVGSLDLFYPECVDYADRLRAAGVPVQEEVAEGAFHAFDMLAPNTSVSQRFFASQCRAVRAALVDAPYQVRDR
ncbi:alpha/beta hydrolase [Mycobacteroides abscessus]|uniref:alpha/beta hydrolase n=1 Tax=Mycobacteroides abscessus TaxID=36809 RepID=UPI00092926DE|nr:alpha/beta hydrolase [Mycobacteroides abscessus]MDO3333969.1 alpha/beta hydrolase [Mycobacteroides abscessus subsp. bolletii]QSM91461.1 alpha/beta hydrolase [Mycobacteroides abscessus subsp. bolletii]SIB91819.1 alpha/beta hydrolase domain-containing protein [Mycobacteroides abscessus subsp. bolletii]SKT09767.1 alpha/beta hydrolase domain-containing protein [Mycobacteroides abscessus subsp. bolletii]SLF30516.1 alpha/beta hydrolase domain-containing protein [Mycobacteroides abscessus subsp. b